MTTSESVITHVTIAAEAAAGKLGTNIVAFDVSQQLTITDVFLIISATNARSGRLSTPWRSSSSNRPS